MGFTLYSWKFAFSLSNIRLITEVLDRIIIKDIFVLYINNITGRSSISSVYRNKTRQKIKKIKGYLKMSNLKRRLKFFLSRWKIILKIFIFFIFNNPMIYQICDVMTSISTWNVSTFLNTCFEPQLIKSSNLANYQI